MMGRWQAVLLSSLIFAIMHFNIVQFIYAFCVGIVLALLMEHTGHLAAAILAHMAANLFAVLRTEYGFLAQTADGSIGAWGVSIFLLLVGIAMGYEFFRKKPSE